ncbi:DUF6816 family protein [Leptolyngbya sp. FACHB-711]|uniref:DUF6816 family protein n=1 Tax=Leptolyngbya sp. FACHB-711 TaxID=2692813 RepID=UPI00168274D6|nr:hypothetical protein [Leptolyngbya sp. FACHB-711]MBD2027593.1 hypothetical protein [Leptolyngbya sp. FACHB-711]
MLKQWRGRLIWLGLLVLLWLLCSGTVLADPLGDRLTQFPNWQGKPIAEPAQGNLAYPDWFAGEWTVTTTLVDLVAPLAPDLVTPGFESNRQFLNQPVTFPVRFVSAQPRGWSAFLPIVSRSPEIVSDRAFNGLSLARAYLGDRSVLSVKVDPQNPNRQITLLRGDAKHFPLQGNRQLVSTVTRRSIEQPAPDRFVTTELFQQEFRGMPQPYFNEVENTTAYTRQSTALSDEPLITADQVTAVYLSPQDPNYFKTLPSANPLGTSRPVALYRYRMEFRQPQDPAAQTPFSS